MNFGERLINLRKQKGMSQEELAEELNMTRQTISKWELGVSTPDMESLKNISNLFGISVDELISNNESTNTNNTINNNPEYVGVNSNYIPNSESYVREDKNSKKMANAYLIFIIVIIALTLTMMIFILCRHFFGWGKIKEDSAGRILNSSLNMMDKQTNTTEKIMENAGNIIKEAQNSIEEDYSITEDNQSMKNEARNFIEDTKNRMEEKQNNSGAYNNIDVYEEYNKAMNVLEDKIESGELQNQINDAKDRLQGVMKNIDFNF